MQERPETAYFTCLFPSCYPHADTENVYLRYILGIVLAGAI